MSIVDDVSRIERMGSDKSKTWEKLCASIDRLGNFLCHALIDENCRERELPFGWKLTVAKISEREPFFWYLTKEDGEKLQISPSKKSREAVIALCEDIAQGLLRGISQEFGKELGTYNSIALNVDAFLGRNNPAINIAVQRSNSNRQSGRYRAFLSTKPGIVEHGTDVAEAVAALIRSFQKDPERLCQ